MSTRLVQQALDLPASERIELIQTLWDSLPQATAEVQLSGAQLDALKRREKQLEERGPSGELWAVVEKRLRSRLR
jgi:putative addiction module component (TIGR02574 family)